MAVRGLLVVLFGAGVVLGGCMQSTIEPASEANFTPRDKKLLAAAPYEKATIPEPYKRHIVEYHRREAPGTILIDSDARYLYYVLPERKAIRYGVTVGEEALAWSGVAKVGRMTEWPSWTPTEEIKKRMDVPNYVGPGPQNPMGARAMYLYEGNKDTLYRIHGTNQPEYIGKAISSGCIRMTNEDVIDLYKRVKPGTMVVVLAPNQGTLRPIREWHRALFTSAECQRIQLKPRPRGAVFVCVSRCAAKSQQIQKLRKPRLCGAPLCAAPRPRHGSTQPNLANFRSDEGIAIIISAQDLQPRPLLPAAVSAAEPRQRCRSRKVHARPIGTCGSLDDAQSNRGGYALRDGRRNRGQAQC